jgi:5'-hydroxyaverantin dehydrogenase
MGPITDLKKPLNYSVLKDKTVLITGGISGLGALTAFAFAKHGALVTTADINEQQGKDFTQEAGQKGLHINFVITDVSDWTSQVNAFKSAIAFGKRNSIDIVIAAAGVSGSVHQSKGGEPPFLDKDPPEPVRSVSAFDVNAKGVYFTCNLANHYFALPSGCSKPPSHSYSKLLVVFSSLAGYLELNNVDYTASKWAVRGMFRALRSMMEDQGYRINLIAPWVMETPMSKGLAEICREKGFPVGDAKNVADAVIRCAADDSINGERAFEKAVILLTKAVRSRFGHWCCRDFRS